MRNATAGRHIRAALIAAIPLALCLLPASGNAQQPKVHRVAFIATTSPLSDLTGTDPSNPAVRAFVHALRDLGYVQGRSLVLDMRTLEGRVEKTEAITADLVRLQTEVIVTGSDVVAQRAAKIASAIPIVVAGGGTMIEMGLVQSLARPGGMVTGLSGDVGAGTEEKRPELLLQVVPKVKRIAFLGPESMWEHPAGKAVRAAALKLGLNVFFAQVRAPDYADAFALIERERPDAVYVPRTATSFGNRSQIGRFLAAQRMPSTCGFSEIVEHGCLMSYGADTNDLFRHLASYVAKILKGARPGDLPIEQPTKFEFVINMKTAKALGLKIPQSVLLRADWVIE